MTRNSKIFANQFVPFLMKHHAFSQYISYYVANFPDTPLDWLIDTTSLNCWISCAFDFDDTPEGFEFWTRLNKEWLVVARHF